MLEIRLLGEQRIDVEGANRTRDVPRRSTGLVCWLVLHAGVPLPRSAVAAQFWPESSGEQSLTNLRRELHLLRRQLPEFAQGLTSAGGTLRWDQDTHVDCDVVRFLAASRLAVAAAEADDDAGFLDAGALAVRSYGGELLPAWADDWVLTERERLHRQCLRLLDSLVAAREQDDPESALAWAQRRLEMEPLEEPAYRVVMRLQVARGDRAAALRTFHRCVTILDRELGVAPDPQTVDVYHSLVASATVGLTATARGEDPRPRLGLVGRERELESLRRRWEIAASGGAGMHLVIGDAGVGKSRLVAELAAEVSRGGDVVARARCFESGARLALAPVTEWLSAPALRAELDTLDEVWAAEVDRLVPAPDRAGSGPPQPMIDAWQRHRFFEGLVHGVLAPGRPTLLTIDDVQWCDTETLTWLHLLLRQGRDHPLLVIATTREEEIDDNEELTRLLRSLEHDAVLSRTSLSTLSPASAGELARLAGGEVEDLDALYAATLGNPLFVIEASRASADRGAPLTTALDGSARVQAVLEGRLSPLSDEAASVARLAAVVGRDFSLELLERASDLAEESVVAALDELWRRRLVVQHSRGSYDFVHDLLRAAALRQIPSPRLALLHRRVAQALEVEPGARAAGAAAVAHHYEQAGVARRALPFHLAAAEFAASRFANDDAIEHYQKALRLLRDQQPGTDRDREELSVRHAMSQPVNARHGYASPLLEATMDRAVLLAERLGDRHLLASSLVGLFSPYVVQGRLQEAYDVASRALAEAGDFPDVLGQAHFSLAGAAVMLGRIDEALEHFDVVPALTMGYPAALVGTRPEVHSRAWESHTLWLAGRPDEARDTVEWAVARSRDVDHPYSLAVSLAYAAMLAQYDGRRDDVVSLATQTGELCTRFGFGYYGHWATVLGGWAHGGREGLARIERGLGGLATDGARLRRPYYLTLYAEVLDELGDQDGAVRALRDARSDAGARHDVTWLPEILRGLARYESRETARSLAAEAELEARRQGSLGLVRRARPPSPASRLTIADGGGVDADRTVAERSRS